MWVGRREPLRRQLAPMVEKEPLRRQLVSHGTRVCNRCIPPMVPGWCIYPGVPPSHATRVVYAGYTPLMLPGWCMQGVSPPLMLPGWCMQGVYLPTMASWSMPGMYTSLLCLPIPPRVYHRPTYHWVHCSTAAGVQADTLLGSKREKPMGGSLSET